VQSFIKWVYGLALSLGGPGLFVVAFLDSSFISLPQINDLLVVLMVVRNKALMPYYALMATAGSVAGCYVLYLIAERGGEAFLAKRVKRGHVDRALAIYRKRGVLALMVPALLPPPSPFKLFVLLAGVAEVRPITFVASIAIARGLRYLVIGALAVRYGDFALDLLRAHGREAALWVAVFIVAAGIAWWLLRRSPRAQS
jgi:membrane protein YqaA with SNARE-associated domain